MRAATFVALLLLAACAHVKVQDVGNGRHALVALSPTGGYYGSHEEAVELANQYCGSSRQSAVIESLDDQPGLGPQGEHSSRIVFTCSAPTTLHF